MNFLFIIFLLFTPFMFAQQTLPCICNGKQINYRALFIDSIGDTLTNENIIVKPTGKNWFFQPRKQSAVDYIYSTDTLGYKKIKHPYISERSQKHFEKTGNIKTNKTETTGYICSDLSFFLHPTRANQYRMLYYAAYPYIIISKLTDTTELFTMTINNLDGEKYIHKYNVAPYLGEENLIDTLNLNYWTVNVNSTVTGLSEYYSNRKYHNSKMEAVYCAEIGYIKMHYTFENGIKIFFDYIENSEP